MRRLLGLLAALVMSIAVLAMPEPAMAGVGVLKIKSAKATDTTPGHSAQIEVAAASDYGVTELVVRLHLVNDRNIIATLNTDRISGTAEDGVWRSTETVTIPDGRVEIEVKAATGLGGHLGYVSAGIIDNGRDVRLSELTASPDSLDSEHGDFRLTGRLVTRATDGTEQGVGHHTIRLLNATQNLEMGYTITDDQGYFSAAAHLNRAARVDAVSPADAIYRTAKIETVVHYTALATRLTIEAPADGGVVGKGMTLTGRLERQSLTGEWSGLSGATVNLSSSGASAIDVVTGADGTYSAQMTVQPGDVYWSALFLGDMGASGTYEHSSAVANGVIVRTQPKIVDLDAGPEPAGRGATVTVRGHVVRPAPAGGTEPAPQAYVGVQFSADGKKWSGPSGFTLTDAHGAFSLGVTADRDGYWRAFVEKDYSYLAATGPSDYVDTKYRTRISGLNASPEPVRKGRTITVAGVLERNTTSWKAFATRSVKIYFRADGSTKWTYAGTARTDGHGRFSFGAKASKDGSWRATYAGDSSYLAVTSAADHVDVR
ncbi:hypothetical protein GCM10023196_091770 [Actinoallomurus vinaceus]|uniref:Carboxypeptidase regulatory-like domain-containing protein n=1 Tax=Actinoallomurus vinaceus TaxID=1080074 RepID=A0ABP8USS9_9ACTN